MKRWIPVLLALVFCYFAAHLIATAQVQGGGVSQYGAVTPGDCTKWFAPGIIEDAGGACGSGGGAVASVSGSGGVACSPTTGAVTCTTTAADNTKTSSYQAASTDMGGALNLTATTGTPALTLPAESSSVFAPGMTLTIVVNGMVNWSLTNSTGLTITGLTGTTLYPGMSGTFVANANATGLDFFPGPTPTGVTAGSYTNTNVTVDAMGRVTSAASGSASGGADACDAWITGTTASPTITPSTGCGSVSNGVYTPPTWADSNTSATADVVGGGGGGDYCNTSSDLGRPGGGGGVSEASGIGLIQTGSTYNFTLALGGTAGSAGTVTGGAGGNSTFAIGSGPTTYTGDGGAGAIACASAAAAVTAGGSFTNGTGFPGGYGWATTAAAGNLQLSGASGLGYGPSIATAVGANTVGVAGLGIGGGGTGSNGTGGAPAGGGAPGGIRLRLSGN